jgi:poly(3-hydroxybutyrate) depolymerase
MSTTHRQAGRLAVLATAAVVAALGAPAMAPAQVPQTCATDGPLQTAYDIGVNCRTVTLEGHHRRFKVYVPARALVVGPPLPLVFMFHGGSGDGEQFLGMSGWREKSNDTGAVSVFPTAMRYRIIDTGGMSTRWHTFALDEPGQQEIDPSVLPPGSAPGSPVPADDVGFVDAIIADVREQLPIDRRRVYASGFSNGAAFTARLSVERSDTFAAVAYSGGAGGTGGRLAPRPVPTWKTVGSLDDRVLAVTNPPLTELPLDPDDILTNFTLGLSYGSSLTTLGLDPGDVGSVEQPHATMLRWPATGTGLNGALLRFGVIGGLTHKYPQAGNNDAGFAAAAEFWEFFNDHRLP